jgi:hypothetical protein
MTRDEATALLAERGVLPTAQRIDIALLTLARRSICRPSKSSRRFARTA